MFGKLEFSAARLRSFLVQLIIPLQSNFFPPCFLELRTRQSVREWADEREGGREDVPRAKVLIERVTRISSEGTQARKSCEANT